jgi:Mg2+/citrate symporter
MPVLPLVSKVASMIGLPLALIAIVMPAGSPVSIVSPVSVTSPISVISGR